MQSEEDKTENSMKRASVLLALIVPLLLLASCSSGSSLDNWQKQGFSELPTATQVAVVLQVPAMLFALAFICNGFPSIVQKISKTTNKIKSEDKD